MSRGLSSRQLRWWSRAPVPVGRPERMGPLDSGLMTLWSSSPRPLDSQLAAYAPMSAERLP